MKNILEHLENTAKKYPDKIGFTDSKRKVSFASLTENAKRIAVSLKNIEKNSPVIIATERSVKCIEAMFAAVYAGCFYTIADINSPKSRLEIISKQLSPKAVITDSKAEEHISGIFQNAEIIRYDDAVTNDIDENFITQRRKSMVDTDTLYVLFTSGSSGIPKGAVLSHRSVINYIQWATTEFSFNEKTSFGAQTPLHFSMSVTDLFSTVKCGGTYNIIPKEYFSFPVKLIEYINDRKINTLYWVPSALGIAFNWNLFEYIAPQYIQTVLFAGEVMPSKYLNYWKKYLPHCTFANLFGPTETTDICTFYVVDRNFSDDEAIPIGRSCDNCDVMLIKDDGTPALPGEEGEMMVRGSFLADGYYNDDEKTVSAFIQNPLNDKYPEKVYRTGDIARLNEKGEFIYINRRDFQIKRMGYRIELGEIETAANSLCGVISAAAVYEQKKEKIILIYEGREKDESKIKSAACKKLPEYMYPDKVIRVDFMPLNSNGKIDRSMLGRVSWI
ncbi:MAG: AMP-binding protein [Anaerovoracaceae bacterium]